MLSRRPGAQLTPFEFVIVFLVGGVIILTTVGDDKSVTNCVCAIIAVVLLHRLVALLRSYFPRIGAVVDGAPLVLLEDGQWRKQVMDRMRVDDTDVMAAARVKGVRDLTGIKYAVLERNGGISIIKAEQP
ncbi:MAG TPA: YetF domain-containing protein [Acidisarcina sp.]